MLVRQSGTAKVGRHFLSRYRFTHTMIQHFLYTNLVKRERQIIHGEIGKILEDVYQEQNQEIVIQLARHFQEADMPDKAKEYLLRAGHHARNRYAHEDAIKFYQRALTILEAAGDQQLIAETKQAMGLVHLVAGNFEEAGKIFNIESAHWELIGYSREKDRRVSPETMRLAVEQPTTLDPGMAVDDVSTFLIAQLFDGLLTLGKDHNILPGIADRWQVDDHGKRYTFYLNEEIYWSDGTRLTAHDFVFGWLRNLHPDTQSPAAHLLYPIRNAREFGEGMIKDPAAVGVKALNELTLEVTLATPAAYFPNLMTLSVSYPLPKWVVEKSPSSWTDPQNLVTNGPYQLTTWQPKEYMLLQKNPYYSMGYFPGNAETINCSLIADYEDTLDQYSRDQFDVVTMFNADPGTVVQARRMFGDELVSISQPSTFYVSFLVDRP
ncbi:MAG: hypothetical protein GWN30_12120, partial [Gammaproteobacteria bacterium]|nr:hypothetical protein [Gammaproteobacteria bacterium]